MNKHFIYFILIAALGLSNSFEQNTANESPKVSQLPENFRCEMIFELVKPTDPGQVNKNAEVIKIETVSSGTYEKQIITWSDETHWTVYFASGLQLWKSPVNNTVTVMGSPGIQANNSNVPCAGLYQTAWIKQEFYQGIKEFEGKKYHFYLEKQNLTVTGQNNNPDIKLPLNQTGGRSAYVSMDTLLPAVVVDSKYVVRYSIKSSSEKVFLPSEYDRAFVDYKNQLNILTKMRRP